MHVHNILLWIYPACSFRAICVAKRWAVALQHPTFPCASEHAYVGTRYRIESCGAWLQVLALTDSALVIRLAATTFFDEDSGKKVTQAPDGDYFLVWRKLGAAAAALAAVETDSDVEVLTPALAVCICT